MNDNKERQSLRIFVWKIMDPFELLPWIDSASPSSPPASQACRGFLCLQTRPLHGDALWCPPADPMPLHRASPPPQFVGVNGDTRVRQRWSHLPLAFGSLLSTAHRGYPTTSFDCDQGRTRRCMPQTSVPCHTLQKFESPPLLVSTSSSPGERFRV